MSWLALARTGRRFGDVCWWLLVAPNNNENKTTVDDTFTENNREYSEKPCPDSIIDHY